MAPTTQARWLVTLTAGGIVLGVFDSFSGGESRGESRQYHAGGMADPTSEVDPPEVSEITISRGWDPARDAVAEKTLRGLIGASCTVGKQALGANRVPIAGALTTYNGRIVGVSTPEHDSMGRDFVRFEVTIVPEGLPA